MSKELDLFHALEKEKESQLNRFIAMTEAAAKILSELTSEEQTKYDNLLQRFTEFGSRSIDAEVDFARLQNEAKTHEDLAQAISRAAAALERDAEELKGFAAELQEILKAHERASR
jgi:hypothetical protein